MNVNNVSIFVGENSQSGQGQLLGLNQKQGNNGAFFAGALNKNVDPIAQKKQQAQKQAMKVVSDAFAADRKLDVEVADREAKIRELRAENLEAERALKELDAQKQGLTEYYDRCKDIDKLAEPYRQTISDNTGAIRSYSAANKAVYKARLDLRKGNPMIAAQEEAEAIMDAARKEIIGMIKNEGMDHIDKELQEKVDQAQKNKEKKEEEEEKLEAIREEKAQIQNRAEAARERAKENEERAEEMLEDMPTEEMLQMNGGKADFQQELKDIMNRMKLMEEDLKGAAVDATL